jgi:hypothetical protein
MSHVEQATQAPFIDVVDPSEAFQFQVDEFCLWFKHSEIDQNVTDTRIGCFERHSRTL